MLIQSHESEWLRFWSRSGIRISDLVLQRTWYRSLYYLRCVSKPGVQSVGLFAGLMNDTPAWHGDYHTNYNIQQTFWTALSANHPELCEPYDRLIFEYLPRAQWLAQNIYSISSDCVDWQEKPGLQRPFRAFLSEPQPYDLHSATDYGRNQSLTKRCLNRWPVWPEIP